MAKPREYTLEEVRHIFLSHVENCVSYWDKVTLDRAPNDTRTDQRNRLEGLAFSIMSALDGCAMGVPGFIVAPSPHPSDKQFHIDEGENYFPYNDSGEIKADIAGGLHELIFKRRELEKDPDEVAL